MSLDGYTIRMFDTGDRPAWLELYETVHGVNHDAEWFGWKYEHNPFTDHVPVLVAEHDDRIVGTRPLLAMPMRAGAWHGVAFEHGDAMVHPDHRRRGLFTAMVERAVARYREADVSFIFSFPNEKSGPAYRQLGWPIVGVVPEAYRFHRPGRVLAGRLDWPPARRLDRFIRQGQGLRDRARAIGRPIPAGVRTELTKAPPVAELEALYRTAIPEQLHAERSAAFLRWRFANPEWTYVTLVGRIDDEAVAALVVGRRREGDGTRVVRITDVLPVDGGWRRDVVLEVLLGDVLEAFDDHDLFIAPGAAMPASARRRWGFHDKDRWPLSKMTQNTTLFVKPLNALPAGVSPTAWDGWKPTFVEYDTA